ncbi:MAG: DUF6491 family protein [Pseudomonadales bacterium]
MNMRSRVRFVHLLRCLLMLISMSGLARAEEPEGAVRCIKLSRISSLEILDKESILFRLRHHKNYVNELPHACPGLRPSRTIMYRTSLDQLCDLDMITVLDDLGAGYIPGASCGLGRFYPISDLEVKDLLKSRRK